MKTIFTILLLSIVTISVKAQDWVHQGSVWHYQYYSWGSGGYVEYKYVKDTSVENHTCHQLSSTKYSSSYIGPSHYQLDTIVESPLHTYSNADTVFYYFSNLGKWMPVYFFGATIGDSLILPNGPPFFNGDTFVHIKIDSTGIMSISTNHLRYYTFHLTDSCAISPFFSGKVIERLGMFDNNLTPYWHCVTDDDSYYFCSYKDDSFALYKPYANCDVLLTGIDNVNMNTGSIYPNPAQDEVNIYLSEISTNMTLTMSDLSGSVLLNQRLESLDEKISVANLGDGIYLMTIRQDGKQLTARKLVISR